MSEVSGRAAIELHEAFARGDWPAAATLLGDPPDFPNTTPPLWIGDSLLGYAIGWSPIPAIAELIALGADVNWIDLGGFPALISAVSMLTGAVHARPPARRDDLPEVIRLLIDAGAALDVRGVNGWTALHWAAVADSAEVVALLLAAGADATLRTGIDDDATPLEEAERAGSAAAAAVLRAHLSA